MKPIRSGHKDFLRSQSLTRKRKKRRILKIWIFSILVIFLGILSAWILSLPSISIQKIVVVGNVNTTSEEIQHITDDILSSKYLGVFSKRNVFIYPKDEIEASLIQIYPRISDISLDTESFITLNIKIKEREAVAIWCAAVQCYLVDSSGYIYAEYHEDISPSIYAGTSTREIVDVSKKALDSLATLHGGDELIGPEPIGKKVFTEKLYTDIRNTLSTLEGLKMSTTDVYFYSRDEIRFVLENGSKIIFSEKKPFEVSIEDLKSALSSEVFLSPSSTRSIGNSKLNFEYIDVRFGNKVFYKLKGMSKEMDSKTSSTSKNVI